MPDNQSLDAQIRAIIDHWPHITAKKLFGGVCYLLNGNMLGGVFKDFLICRIGEAAAAEALKRPTSGPLTFPVSP
jgi:TfoX/Sxy family transcriptional regulator of competence genes